MFLILFGGILIFLLLGSAFYYHENQAPQAFQVHSIFTINKGETLSSVSQRLRNQSFIRSVRLFQWTVTAIAGEQDVVAGSYYFPTKITSMAIAKRITIGDYGFVAKKVTFPEGFTVKDISKRIKSTFPLFDDKKFIKLATPQEGFLFPDTYDFYPNVTPETVIQTMSKNFQIKTASIQKEIQSNPHQNLRDIIIMASILEKEAKTTQSRRIISGILWKRISKGIHLQVDAPFAYFLGKKSSQLTKKDLKIDSPYNTYLYKGLPVGPISNPGLDSIKAALNPEKTDYLYYLSDKNGDMHYSKTFAEHTAKKAKYLNN
jgi:UPF0755 protein